MTSGRCVNQLRMSSCQVEMTKIPMNAQFASQITMTIGHKGDFDRLLMNFAKRLMAQAIATETTSQAPP